MTQSTDQAAPLIWTSVSSSNIAACAYDAQDSQLLIRFQSGQVWSYGVSRAVYDALIVSPSKGKYFNGFIKPIGGSRVGG